MASDNTSSKPRIQFRDTVSSISLGSDPSPITPTPPPNRQASRTFSRYGPVLDATQDLLGKDTRRHGTESVPIHTPQRGPLGTCFAMVGHRAADCCAPSLDSPRKVSRVKRRDGSHDGLVFKQGLLWKLNHDVDGDLSQDEFPKLRNWRRRNFFIVQNGDELVMVYRSEKEGGRLQLGATFDKTTKAEWLPDPVVMCKFSADTQYWASTNLQHYDIAFMNQESMKTGEDYARQVPSELYIFTVLWKDRDGEDHKLTLGTTEQDRQKWMKAIRVRFMVNFGGEIVRI